MAGRRRTTGRVGLVGLLAAGGIALGGGTPAGAVTVTDSAGLTAAWLDPTVAEVVLDADIELDCALNTRPAGAVPLTVDGQGHRIDEVCERRPAAQTFEAQTPVALTDIAIHGRDSRRDRYVLIRMRDTALTVTSSTLVLPNRDGTVVQVGPGSSFVDSVVGEGDETARGISASGPLTIERSRVSAFVYAVLVSGPGEVLVRDAVLADADVGIRTENPTRIERSSISGRSIGILTQRQGIVVDVTDSTIAVVPAEVAHPPLRAVLADNSAIVTIENSTVVAEEGGGSALDALGGARIRVGASIIHQRTSEPACRLLGGAIESLGHNVVVDDSCGLTEEGDLVADPRIAAFDPGSQLAVTAADSPAVDHVPADVCTSTSDQVGLARPQGPACDAGALELEALAPPTSSTTTSTTTTTTVVTGPGPGVTAPPATPVRTDARFTG